MISSPIGVLPLWRETGRDCFFASPAHLAVRTSRTVARRLRQPCSRLPEKLRVSFTNTFRIINLPRTEKLI